jgi:hypothetical protein
LHRCIVGCPGSLAEQGQDELYRRFHLPFEILTNDKLEAARTGNWFLETNLVIGRLDRLSRNEDVQQKLQAPDCRPIKQLSGYDPARDAPSCIPSRVARIIILPGVDHDRSTARMKDRVGLVFLECQGRIEDLDVKAALSWNVQIRHIAGVPRTGEYAVMRTGWIKMAACRGKIGRVAFPNGMNVEGVLPSGQASDGKTDQDACRRLSKGGYADILASWVLERGFGSCGIFRGSPLWQ